MAVDINSSGFSHLTAAADYTGNQFHLGAVNSSGTVTLGSVLGQKVDGVIYNEPNTGEAVDLRAFGVGKVRCGGTIAAGDKLVCAASGEAVSLSASGQYVFGRALEAGANDSVISVLWTHEGKENITVLAFPIQLSTVTAADVVTAFPLSFPGKILSLHFVVTTVVTTAAKAATLNLEIGTTNLTGGAVALTSANCTPLGAVIAGAAITNGNTFVTGDTLSVEASSVTAFSEGAGTLYVVIA